MVALHWQAFPDVSKAKSSIQNVFTLIDSRPKNIDIDAPGKNKRPTLRTLSCLQCSVTALHICNVHASCLLSS
jgi:hypothetical protein